MRLLDKLFLGNDSIKKLTKKNNAEELVQEFNKIYSVNNLSLYFLPLISDNLKKVSLNNHQYYELYRKTKLFINSQN